MSLEKYLEALEKGITFADVVSERSLSPEEKKKREEIAQAIEREHPEYDMDKKMAIATAKAKECCDEGFADTYHSTKLKVEKEKLRKRGMVDQAEKITLDDIKKKYPVKVSEDVELDEGFADTYHATKLKVEKEKLRKRGMVDQAEKITLDDIKKKYPVKVSEDVEQIDELSKKTVLSYRDKAKESVKKAEKQANKYQKDMATQGKYRDHWKDVKDGKIEHEWHPNYPQQHRDKATEIAHRDADASFKKAADKYHTYRDIVKKRTAGINRATDRLTKEEVEQIDEMRSPFHKAATELEKHAKKLGSNHMDHDDFMNHAKALKQYDPSEWRHSAQSLKNLDTVARDTVLDHIHKHTAKKDMSAAYYKASGHTRIAEEALEEGSWTDERSCYDGPGKGKELTKMSEKEHADAINHHKTQMYQLNTGTHKYSKTYDKQEKQDKYHYHAHKASLHKDALDHYQMYNEDVNEEKDTSALDAMDAKEKRKDKIRQYIKNQSPVKIKRTPGKPEVKEEVELTESSDFHAKPTASGHEHYAVLDDNKSAWQKKMNTRKDGHTYVGTAGYHKPNEERKPNTGRLYKSGMIVKHKDTGKYAVGNISAKTTWHDTVEHATADAHKRFRMDHQHVTPEHVKVVSRKDYDTHVNKPVNEDIELDEAVKFEHDRVMRSQGKKNSYTGHALWMFTHKRTGDVDYDNERECHQVSATRKDAQKSATEWANKHGHKTVYFME